MIRTLLDIYIFVLIADAVLSFFPQVRHHQVVLGVKQAADFTCRPVRRLLPQDLPFDFSPLIVILGIKLIEVLW